METGKQWTDRQTVRKANRHAERQATKVKNAAGVLLAAVNPYSKEGRIAGVQPEGEVKREALNSSPRGLHVGLSCKGSPISKSGNNIIQVVNVTNANVRHKTHTHIHNIQNPRA